MYPNSCDIRAVWITSKRENRERCSCDRVSSCEPCQLVPLHGWLFHCQTYLPCNNCDSCQEQLNKQKKVKLSGQRNAIASAVRNAPRISCSSHDLHEMFQSRNDKRCMFRFCGVEGCRTLHHFQQAGEHAAGATAVQQVTPI
jgi:hypothetical protein